jgi:hypothetical protein
MICGLEFWRYCVCEKTMDHSFGIAIGYRMHGRGSIPDRDKIFVSFPQCPDRLWGSCNLLSNRCRGLVPRG